MFPDYMQTYEIEATSGFLVSEARKSKETAEKIVLEAFASMYQEMAVICNPTDTKTSNTNRDGKDDK